MFKIIEILDIHGFTYQTALSTKHLQKKCQFLGFTSGAGMERVSTQCDIHVTDGGSKPSPTACRPLMHVMLRSIWSKRSLINCLGKKK